MQRKEDAEVVDCRCKQWQRNEGVRQEEEEEEEEDDESGRRQLFVSRLNKLICSNVWFALR